MQIYMKFLNYTQTNKFFVGCTACVRKKRRKDIKFTKIVFMKRKIFYRKEKITIFAPLFLKNNIFFT